MKSDNSKVDLGELWTWNKPRTVYSHVVFDMRTGRVLHAEKDLSFGPWALCKAAEPELPSTDDSEGVDEPPPDGATPEEILDVFEGEDESELDASAAAITEPEREPAPEEEPPEALTLDDFRRGIDEMAGSLTIGGPSADAEPPAVRAQLPAAPAPAMPEQTGNIPKDAYLERPAEFVQQGELEQMLESPQKFNEVMNRIQAAMAERVLMVVHPAVRRAVEERLTVSQQVDNFYAKNSDLEPYRRTVGYIATRLLKANPTGYTHESLMTDAEKTARNILRLPRKAAEPEPSKEAPAAAATARQRPRTGKPGFVARKPSGERPASQKLTPLEQEIAETLGIGSEE